MHVAANDAKAPALKKRKIQEIRSPPPKLGKKKSTSFVEEEVVKVSTKSKIAKPTTKGKGKTSVINTKPATVKATASVALPCLPKTFKIIAGSYEKLLYGLEGSFESNDPSSSKPHPTLKPIFIFPAHVGCIKAVAGSPSGGKWLATGSTDEIIKVWDLRRRKEIGGLIQHEGTLPVNWVDLLLFIYSFIRINYLFDIPIPLPSPFCIRGWNT